MLERFRLAKKAEITALERLARQKNLPPALTHSRPSLARALKHKGPGAVIAEFKPASPSLGIINTRLEPEDAARAYAMGGASALSVLTEEKYFHGFLDFVDRMTGPGLPVLRKDFLFHPLQIRATAATKASALLLIVAMFKQPEDLAGMIGLCRHHNLEAVVEIFAPHELEIARQAGANIIQVNNRNLETLEMDPQRALRLIEQKKADEVWIAASGVSSHDQWHTMQKAGYDGVLIGTSLMRAKDQTRALRAILGEIS